MRDIPRNRDGRDIAMELRLPQKKISELKGLIRVWLGRRSCLKRELQSLVGKLQHACKVVKPGRSFLRRMFELLAGVHKDHHHIRLNTSFRSDLVWWDIRFWRRGTGNLP